jgi:hypothetical protein
MVYDHAATRQLTARLQEAGNDDVSLLQELLYGLHALITVSRLFGKSSLRQSAAPSATARQESSAR